jgi:hypothetical protein
MHTLHQQWRRLIAAAVVCLICPPVVKAADETTLTKEQIKKFLLTAKIVGSKQSKKGVTNTSRLTLSDGTVTHDASFHGGETAGALHRPFPWSSSIEALTPSPGRQGILGRDLHSTSIESS